MSDFVVLFHPCSSSPDVGGFDTVARAMCDARVSKTLRAIVPGMAADLDDGGAAPLRWARRDDEGSWIVVKGIIFDVSAEGPFDLERLLREFVSEGKVDWNRFEGTFALAAWDGTKRHGIAINDQTSVLNLYFTETPAGTFVSTTALSLARALGRALDPAAAREFIARGSVLAPRSMFEGIGRLNVGEQLRIGERTELVRHWDYPRDRAKWSRRRAVEEAAGVASDRIRRYADAVGGRLLFDLTSGYDSRLLSAAASRAGVDMAVTVNGPVENEEVRISHLVARAAGWEMHHIDPREAWNRTIDAGMRSELTYRTDGNLTFPSVYQHLVTRPQLATQFAMHAAGVGGEFIRYHPWGQEFFGIGRRRMANVDNLLRYRFLQDGPPPQGLFKESWYNIFRRDLRDRVTAKCREMLDTLTTQQLDAVHVWKQTGHSSLYVSSDYNWLPTAVPSMGAGFVEVGMRMPWRYRLTARLTCDVIHELCPRAADVVTQYGGTAGKVRLSNLHLHLYQPVKRMHHLASKVYRVAFGRRGKPAAVAAVDTPRKPYLTEEFRNWLDPATMRSREMYDTNALRAFLSGTDADLYTRETWLLRIATIEQLCQELDVSPPGDFLSR